MSTFGGFMPEFPDIRVDYFCKIPDKRAPLACFLSHVHSDHLVGLETFKGCLSVLDSHQGIHRGMLTRGSIYCSAATKQLLLRLERYPHRLNFAQGVLERRKQTYKGLIKSLLKPIPLETPTAIELEPGNQIQVTLFDSNHCTGSVMFLIEDDTKAVLYTGDIRSEPWFVNSLVRNPLLIEYTSGLKSLDCIYLDTSCTGSVRFPTKAQGLKELLQKVSRYPPDTIFHFSAWTFGYEEVWLALSKALKSPIHVDDYQLKLYQSLTSTADGKQSDSVLIRDGAALAGHTCGNTPHAGCLTGDVNVRIHSCQTGLHCDTIGPNTVWIRPILGRTENGQDLQEIGVGGGMGDLTRRPELDLNGLEFTSDEMLDAALDLFEASGNVDSSKIKALLSKACATGRSISLDGVKLGEEEEPAALDQVAHALTTLYNKSHNVPIEPLSQHDSVSPKIITFPYARHSDYYELCHLVQVFDPKDVYPCTVDEKSWDEDVSMKTLFGRHCSAIRFRHDDEMRRLREIQAIEENGSQQTHTTISSQSSGGVSSQLGHHVLVEHPPETPNKDPEAAALSFDASPFTHRASGAGGHNSPPSQIVATSPGSESQSLRRKAILDEMSGNTSKKARFLDGTHSSPSPSQLVGRGESIPSRNTQFALHESMDVEEDHNDATLEGSISEDWLDDSMEDDAVQSMSFWDAVDSIFRCRQCGHELDGDRGHCREVTCPANDEPPLFHEVYDYTQHKGTPVCEAEIVTNLDMEPEDLHVEQREKLVGRYLDYDSSAYDSQDDVEHVLDEYEVNSFIDDGSIASEGEGEADEPSADGEEDFKSKFKELEATHRLLIDDYCSLAKSYDGLREDCGLLSDSGEDDDNELEDEKDEEGYLHVEVKTEVNTVVAEIVVDPVDGQSQKSVISPERARDRDMAFEAAAGGQWSDVSLVSVGNNHTHPEIEL